MPRVNQDFEHTPPHQDHGWPFPTGTTDTSLLGISPSDAHLIVNPPDHLTTADMVPDVVQTLDNGRSPLSPQSVYVPDDNPQWRAVQDITAALTKLVTQWDSHSIRVVPSSRMVTQRTTLATPGQAYNLAGEDSRRRSMTVRFQSTVPGDVLYIGADMSVPGNGYPLLTTDPPLLITTGQEIWVALGSGNTGVGTLSSLWEVYG
jgi:hypothetical protein